MRRPVKHVHAVRAIPDEYQKTTVPKSRHQPPEPPEPKKQKEKPVEKVQE